MGFPNCPNCVVLAFITILIAITRCYMFFTLLRELINKESNLKLKINLALWLKLSINT